MLRACGPHGTLALCAGQGWEMKAGVDEKQAARGQAGRRQHERGEVS